MNRPPEVAAVPPLWRALGAVMPRRIREGIYEPAYLDLWRAFAADEQSTDRWRTMLMSASLVGYLLASVWYSIPSYLGGWGRTRRARWAARIAMAVVAFGTLVILMLPRIMTY